MVHISAPQPHLAPAFRYARNPARTQSLPTAVADDTFFVSRRAYTHLRLALMSLQCIPQPQPMPSPPRLLSPYRLPEDAGLRKVSSLYALRVRSDPDLRSYPSRRVALPRGAGAPFVTYPVLLVTATAPEQTVVSIPLLSLSHLSMTSPGSPHYPSSPTLPTHGT